MKINEKVQKLTPYDVAKINELLAGNDYPQIARHLLKGNVKLALSAQRLLMKDLRNNPQGFTKRELTLILGVTNDKVTNALKAKVVSNLSSNGDDKKGKEEEKSIVCVDDDVEELDVDGNPIPEADLELRREL